MSDPHDILQFVEGLDAGDRVAWIGALDQACELAERRRRTFARKDRDRAATAQSFVEQLPCCSGCGPATARRRNTSP